MSLSPNSKVLLLKGYWGCTIEPKPILDHINKENLIGEVITEREPIMNEFLIKNVIEKGTTEPEPKL